MTAHIYLIRHGHSEGNQNHCFLGRLDPPLTEKGAKQILARRGVEVDEVFCSPLKRAFQSAELLFGNQAEVMDELIEQDFGLWEGLTQEQAKKTYPKDFEAWATGDPNFPPTQGETLLQVQNRIKPFVASLLRKQAGSVAVVAHGGLLQVLCCTLLKTQLSNLWPYRFQQAGIAYICVRDQFAFLMSFQGSPT